MPYVFTVRMTPETAWEVIGTWNGPAAREEVLFRGYAEYQAHCVAQALAHYVEHERPPQPMQEAYGPCSRQFPPDPEPGKYAPLRLVKGGEEL